MEIRTNISAMNAHLRMKQSSAEQGKAAERLTSGHRINSAADDPAGLAISESMRAQIMGLDQAERNTNDGIALIETAEGGLQKICDMIHRLRELVVQASNDTTTPSRIHIQEEIDQILAEIDSLAHRLEYNGRPLLSGEYGGRANPNDPNNTPLFFQVGANSDNGFVLFIESVTAEGLGLLNSNGSRVLDVVQSTGAAIHHLLDTIDAALAKSLEERSHLGASISRLDHARQAVATTSENLSDAHSRVRDADMAREMMDYMQMNVLFSAASSMLSQANQSPNMVLQLLQG